MLLCRSCRPSSWRADRALDFHLGFPSRGERAVERAVRWVAEEKPDLTLITGDLLSRPSAEPRLRTILEQLPGSPGASNYDPATSRDPFSKPSAVSNLGSTTVFFDEARIVEVRGRRAQIVGIDPRSYRRGTARPERLADFDADLRILLCHFPNVIDRLTPGASTSFSPVTSTPVRS